MAARNKPPEGKQWTPEIVRRRLKTSMIANRLTDHILGEVEMTSTQVTAALGLLRKTMPDLSAISHSGSIETTKPEELSDSQLADIATRSGNRAIEAQSGEEEPSELH
jgi:hypothetical protein